MPQQHSVPSSKGRGQEELSRNAHNIFGASGGMGDVDALLRDLLGDDEEEGLNGGGSAAAAPPRGEAHERTRLLPVVAAQGLFACSRVQGCACHCCLPATLSAHQLPRMHARTGHAQLRTQTRRGGGGTGREGARAWAWAAPGHAAAGWGGG